LTAQHSFTKTLGLALDQWAAANELALQRLFNGEPDSIKTLTTLIKNGHFIAGKKNLQKEIQVSKPMQQELRANIARSFYAFAVPTAWYYSSQAVFVMNSGYRCGQIDPLDKEISKAVMHKTAACVDGDLYYLLSAPGKGLANVQCDGDPFCQGDNVSTGQAGSKVLFTAPPGIDALDGKDWGKITVQQIVTGAVNTWKRNGMQNVGDLADVSRENTLEALQKQDITTPGYITLPVCSPNMARLAYNDNGKTVNRNDPLYPCLPLPGKTECWDFTFEDRTSDASPSVSDCQGIINEVQGSVQNWERNIGPHTDVAEKGACKVGVESGIPNGPVVYWVGDQDVVNIVAESIKRFARKDGKVGAAGSMRCKGNIGNQYIKWGLY
jgi:hypothetical protein